MITLSTILHSLKSSESIYSDIAWEDRNNDKLAIKLDKEIKDLRDNLNGIKSGEILPHFTFKGEYYYPFYIS